MILLVFLLACTNILRISKVSPSTSQLNIIHIFDDIMGTAVFQSCSDHARPATCANGNDSSTPVAIPEWIPLEESSNTTHLFLIVSKAVGRQKEWIRRLLSSPQSFVVGSSHQQKGKKNSGFFFFPTRFHRFPGFRKPRNQLQFSIQPN